MTPEERLDISQHVYWNIWRHKEAFMRSQNPDWTEEQIQRRAWEIFFNSEKQFGWRPRV